MSARIFGLVSEEARKRCALFAMTGPEGWVAKFSEPTRNLGQNAALHARIGEIAERCEWAGRRWDIETWKRLLVGAWDRATGEPVLMLPALDGHGVEIIFRRTSTLTKRECSDLMEFVNAWAAERPEMNEEARATT